jgi:hypothetical protein
MEEIGMEVTQYEKGDFGFYLPSCWEHVTDEEEGFVEKFDLSEIGRLSVECLPLATEDDCQDPTEILKSRDPGPDEVAGPIVRLASGFAIQIYSHGDEAVAKFRWLQCEMAWCFEPGVFASIRFSGCTTLERLRNPLVLMHAHLVHVCARRTEIVT